MRKAIAVSLALVLSGAVSLLAQVRVISCAPPAGPSIPTLVQDRAWGTNNGGQTIGTIYYTLQHAVLASNALLFALSYDGAAATVTITDDAGAGVNTWSLLKSSNDGTRVKVIYASLGTAAGTQQIKVVFSGTGAPVYNVHARATEFYNVATSAAVDGTASGASGITGPTIAAGSITTTVDNDLIYHYGVDEASLCCTAAVTTYVVGSGFALLPSSRHLGHFAQWQVQAAHAAINPTMTANQGTHDTFGSVAVALKAATAGTAPTVVPRIVYQISESLNAAAYTVQFPCPGCNLIVTRTAENTTQNAITTVVDTETNTYTKVTAAASYPQMFYTAVPTITNSNTRTMTFNNANSGVTAIAVISGIVGAATSPLGAVVTSTPADQTAAGGANCPGIAGSDIDHAPDITTTKAGSLVMAVANNGTGPECALRGAGYVLDSSWYLGQDDSSTGYMESSSGYGHINVGAIATYDFHWDFANASISGSNVLGVEFKVP